MLSLVWLYRITFASSISWSRRLYLFYSIFRSDAQPTTTQDIAIFFCGANDLRCKVLCLLSTLDDMIYIHWIDFSWNIDGDDSNKNNNNRMYSVFCTSIPLIRNENDAICFFISLCASLSQWLLLFPSHIAPMTWGNEYILPMICYNSHSTAWYKLKRSLSSNKFCRFRIKLSA